MATMLHIQRFIHAACNLYSKILVRMIFNNSQSVPFGRLKCSKNEKEGEFKRECVTSTQNRGDAERTFDESGVGRNVTLPISLSSSASIPGFSVYNFTLTTGNGCVVVKSPWVSHLQIEIQCMQSPTCAINVQPVITILDSSLVSLHWFRCFGLIGLQFFAIFDFHGAVNDAIGCQ